ncbi:MAG: HlyD family efflux transporter periplasmic adaptor subunit [Hyphomicrobiales bacterium]|nr:HlyD family efflux transporter periplasmic adaptor subunit [Hyphomicrobiales bacterium]
MVASLVALGGAGGWYWWQLQLNVLPSGIEKANGRLETERVHVSTKYQGRIATVLVKEGDTIDAGEVVARMDTAELEAQLHRAEADVRKAEHVKTQAEALVVQRESERTFAKQELQRALALVERGWSTREQVDDRENQIRVAQAAYDTAVANLDGAKAQIVSGQAAVADLKTQIQDSTLVSPCRARVRDKLAQPGEVLPAGGRVLTLLDLDDVYMTVFVPARVAGRVTVGDEARIVLDPVPGYVFPAKVAFIDTTEAQFTKAIEAAEERGLMFRVKLAIAPELAKRYQNRAKTGIRGVGFVRTDPETSWPDKLSIKLP